MDGHREAEPYVHARRVVPYRFVDEAVQFGEGHDVIESLSDVPLSKAEDGAVQVDVLPAGEFRMEPSTQLEQGRQAAVDGGRSLVGPEDAGQHLEQRALAGSVAADDAERLSLLDVQGEVAQGPELFVAGPVARQHGGLEGPVSVVGETELLTQAVQSDGYVRRRAQWRSR